MRKVVDRSAPRLPRESEGNSSFSSIGEELLDSRIRNRSLLVSPVENVDQSPEVSQARKHVQDRLALEQGIRRIGDELEAAKQENAFLRERVGRQQKEREAQERSKLLLQQCLLQKDIELGECRKKMGIILKDQQRMLILVKQLQLSLEEKQLRLAKCQEAQREESANNLIQTLKMELFASKREVQLLKKQKEFQEFSVARRYASGASTERRPKSVNKDKGEVNEAIEAVFWLTKLGSKREAASIAKGLVKFAASFLDLVSKLGGRVEQGGQFLGRLGSAWRFLKQFLRVRI